MVMSYVPMFMCKMPRVSCWKRGITSTDRGSFQPDSHQRLSFVWPKWKEKGGVDFKWQNTNF